MLTITTLRRLCLIEGVSLLLLVFVAVPLKHVWEEPMAVRYIGMAHGLLWLALVVLLVVVARRHHWSLGRNAAVFISSILPFGFLVMDRRMATWDRQPEPQGTGS